MESERSKSTEVLYYRLVMPDYSTRLFALFDCPHCMEAQAPTRGTVGGYCCPLCGEYLTFKVPGAMARAMETANEERGEDAASATQRQERNVHPEQELREAALLALPDVLKSYREAVLAQVRQYRPFSPSYSTFCLLYNMLGAALESAEEAALIVKAERDHNVE